MKYQHTAQLLQQIEAEMKALQLWTQAIPSTEALASTAPFACDVMTLAQWLQFIFLPRMQALLDDRLPLPQSCSIYPMAELAWAPCIEDKLPLLSRIKALDTLLSEAATTPSGHHSKKAPFQLVPNSSNDMDLANSQSVVASEAAPLLTILYLDQYLVAVDKPAGMLVHRSFLDKHETLFVMQTLRNQLGQHVFPVHRLDRPTSGVLVFALSSEVARLLTEQHQQESWQKFYLAIVRSYVKAPLLLDYPLYEQLDKIADKKADQHKAAQDARTALWPLAQIELPIAIGRYAGARYSLVALQPLTGRKHQLRRHLAHLRHPIVGDTSHGDGRHNQLFANNLSAKRLMLVAKRLQIQHPVTGVLLQFDAGLQELRPLFLQFGWPIDEDYFQQLWSTLDYQQLPVQADPAKPGQ